MRKLSYGKNGISISVQEDLTLETYVLFRFVPLNGDSDIYIEADILYYSCYTGLLYVSLPIEDETMYGEYNVFVYMVDSSEAIHSDLMRLSAYEYVENDAGVVIIRKDPNDLYYYSLAEMAEALDFTVKCVTAGDIVTYNGETVTYNGETVTYYYNG